MITEGKMRGGIRINHKKIFGKNYDNQIKNK